MSKTIVYGGTGFIGRALQEHVSAIGLADQFIFTYHEHPERIQKGIVGIKSSSLNAGLFKNCIYINGPIDELLESFRGNLVMLSSQKVITNQWCDEHDRELEALTAMKMGNLKRLEIYRLSHAFGKGEKENRLIQLCAKSAINGTEITIYDNGTTPINPLPVSFVAEALECASDFLEAEKEGHIEIIDLMYDQDIRTIDIVNYLNACSPFHFTVTVEKRHESEDGSLGTPAALNKKLLKWALIYPAVYDEMRAYFADCMTTEMNRQPHGRM